MNNQYVNSNSIIVNDPLGYRQNAWPVAILLLLAGLVFHDLPSGYWRADDPFLLWHALNSNGLSAFYDPNDWQKLSPSNLTPWITFSFKIDLWLAGLSPKFFYIHQLFSLGMVLVAAYALCRHWVSPVWAFLSVCLFLVGAPTASVIETLMTRHYLEGMLFALLAMLAFLHSLRQQSMPWAFAGALAYALAVTAKEIYVPLVLLVLVTPPVNNLATRLRLASPFIGVAILYIFWRQYMLGEFIGGYTDAYSILSFRAVKAILGALVHIPGYFFGPSSILVAILFFSILVILFFKRASFLLKKVTSMILISIALLVGVVGPLIPLMVSTGIGMRYLYLFWFVASLACVFTIQITSSMISSNKNVQYAIGIPLCLVLMTLTILYTKNVAMTQRGIYQEYDVQGRFIFEADKRQGFLPTQHLLHTYWYVSRLCYIKERMGLECPIALIKGLPASKNIDRLSAYDSGQAVMVDISSKINEVVASIETIDLTRPLFGKVSLGNGWLRWNFGPYDNGQYYLASSMWGRYPMNKTGEMRRRVSADIPVYLQYESPDGWVTSSPMLNIQEGRPVVWERAPVK